MSYIKTDEMTPKQISLIINFNPVDYEKIQSLSLNFTMYYKSKESLEIIQSNSFLYFYDYNKSFEEPYFSNEIHFNNDYDKITALQTTDDFWNTNYQFPKSFNEEKSIEFLKKYGNLINYENTIPSDELEHTKSSVISWDKVKRLEWTSIKQNLAENKKENTNRGLTSNRDVDKVSYSSFDIIKFQQSNRSLGIPEKFNFSYLLDQYVDKNGVKQFITRTIFDRNSSFSRYDRTKNKLIYINLIFDIYEYYRQNLIAVVNKNMNFDTVKDMCKEKFQEATLTVKKMENETNSGLNFQSLVRWNNTIKAKLNIDNFSQIANQK